MRLKLIREQGKIFLIRLSKCWGQGSIKLHIILNDDKGAPHTHPWDFKSFILFGGYKELSFYPDRQEFEGEWNTYKWLSVNTKKANVSHLVELRRFMGIRIPAITLVKCGPKKQLCSLCQELGYCKSQKQK